MKGKTRSANHETFTTNTNPLLTNNYYYGAILGGNTTKHAANVYSKGNMLYVADVDINEETPAIDLFNNVSVIKNEYLRSGNIEVFASGVLNTKKFGDIQSYTGLTSGMNIGLNQALITNYNQNQYGTYSNTISQLLNTENLNNHNSYTYGILMNSNNGSETTSAINLFHNNGITFINKEENKAQISYTFPRNNGTDGQVLTTNGGNGHATQVWKNISDIYSPSSPRYFYFPTLSLPISTSNANRVGISYNQADGTYQVDLFEILRNQMANPVASSNASSDYLSELVLQRDKYEYFVIEANQQIFKNISFLRGNGNEGKLVYKVNSVENAPNSETMNIIIKLKQ